MPLGKCPDCGRTARLGKLVGERHGVNPDGSWRKEAIPTDERLRCMDCCFGPLMVSSKSCLEFGAQPAALFYCEDYGVAEGAHDEARPSQVRPRNPGIIKRMDLWLQAWCLRIEVKDTHAWCAKMERLNSLKVTSRQILRTTADVRSLNEQH